MECTKYYLSSKPLFCLHKELISMLAKMPEICHQHLYLPADATKTPNFIPTPYALCSTISRRRNEAHINDCSVHYYRLWDVTVGLPRCKLQVGNIKV